MRLLVLIPDLISRGPARALMEFVGRHHRLERTFVRHRIGVHPWLYTHVAWGGTLNLMRHCAVAHSLGAPAALLSPTGRDTYGEFNVVRAPFVRWRDRRDDDVVLIPDFCSELADDVRGPVIVYLQVPTHVRADFDYLDSRVTLWTDSPFMLEVCRRVFPGKPIEIVPNIVDDQTFPFVPQDQREAGLLMAFPRKGPDFIAATAARYRELRGTYWQFELIDGIPLVELAERMRRPQAFLASAEVEGCALPPQECMAAGIVVVGKNARGANFAMQHRSTAMIAETPEEAARCLRELEDAALRTRIATAAHEFIARYFPQGEPAQLWRRTLDGYGFALRPRPSAPL